MTSNLSGKTAIVSGGAGSIGQAILKRLLEDGCNVACLDLRTGQISRDFHMPDKFIAMDCDLADENQVATAIRTVKDKFGRIDFLVNAAGRVGPTKPVSELDLDEYHDLFRSNVQTCLVGMKLVLPHLQQQGQGGAIVNLASTAADRIRAGRSLYAMTKRAVIALTVAAAHENASHKIRVNCVAPGPIDSEMYRQMMASAPLPPGQAAPAIGPLGQPEDVAAMVSFLLSDDARHCTGHVYYVDGGAAA